MTKEEHCSRANKLVNDIQITVKKKSTALTLKGIWQVSFAIVAILLLCYLFFFVVKSGTISVGNTPSSSDTPTVNVFISACYVLIFVAVLSVCAWGINRTKVYTDREQKLCKELIDLRVSYLCERFNLTQAQLNYDLTGILNAHPQFKQDWWKHNDYVDVIANALEQKYRRNTTEEKVSELHIENLKLQNESLEIDNSQKKLWVCSFCGNTNRGDDMSCIKCGGIRPNNSHQH